MNLSKVCSCLNNEAQIDGIISDTEQIQSSIDSARQITSNMEGLNIVSMVYNGGETDNIIVTVDNTQKTITATLKGIQYESKLNFPNVGSPNLIYVDVSENASYRWDSNTLTYICVGRDYNEIAIISGGNA